MKQLLLFGMALLAVISGIIWFRHERVSEPEKIVIQMLKAAKKGDLEEVESYTVQGLGINYSGKKTHALLKAIGATLQYQVADPVIQQNYAQMDVTITVVDVSSMLGDLSYLLLQDSLSSTASTEKPFYKTLIEQIKQQPHTTITSTVTVQLVQNETWVVDVAQSNGLISAMTGGLYASFP